MREYTGIQASGFASISQCFIDKYISIHKLIAQAKYNNCNISYNEKCVSTQQLRTYTSDVDKLWNVERCGQKVNNRTVNRPK